jgi:hypothetical protein
MPLILGPCAPDGDTYGLFAEGVAPEDFFSEQHRRVFEAALSLKSAGAPTEVPAIVGRLQSTGRLAQCGGASAVTSLLIDTPVGQVGFYGDIVKRDSRARRSLLLWQRLTAQTFAGCDPDALVQSAAAEIEALRAASASSTVLMLDGPAMAKPLPDVDYLVRDIGLVAGGGAPHLFAGYGFTGKTLAAQSKALSLAAGRPVWGAYHGKRSRVVHVDFEQGERLTVRRYQRLAAAMGVDLAELGDALALVVMPSVTLSPAHSDAWKRLMSGRDLVIIDSLRAATGGQDENSSDIRSGLDLLGHLSEQTGCRAAVILHARKPSEDAPAGRYAIRGSSAIYDAADSAYVFGAGKGEPIAVEHVKARSHGEPVEDFALTVSDVEIAGDSKGGVRVQAHGAELVTERRASQAEAKRDDKTRRDAETVRKAIAQRPGLGKVELRAVTRLSGDDLAGALLAIGDDVEVREVKAGRGPGKLCHYLRREP